MKAPLIYMTALMFFSSAAQAQQLSALKEHDVDQLIDVSAERVQVEERENLAVFSGDVQVVQGKLNLIANELRVYYGRTGENGDGLTILRLDAQGAVRLTSPSEVVDSQWGIYDVENEVITMGGTVKMARGDTKLNGERMVLNLRTGQSTLDGGTSTEQNERVRGRFTVPKKSESDSNGG
ncbi:MAG: LptA/OstA family protein [Sphingomonadales bacterium]|jgi:lipopolysaccharide export system protein LptA